MDDGSTEKQGICDDSASTSFGNKRDDIFQQAALWAAVANNIPTTVFVVNVHGLIVSANAAATSQFKNKNTHGLPVSEILEIPGGAGAWQKHLADALKGKVKQFQCDGRANGAGHRFHAHVVIREIHVGADPHILVSAQDITRFRRRENALAVMAKTDELTELNNRRQFFKLLETELKRVKRYNNPLSLMMIDIDHFKNINDRYGHQVGDEVLRAFANTGKKILRSIDIFARLGGEEFAIALPETDLRAARAVAERLRQAVSTKKVETRNGPVQYTVSIGVITSAPWSLNPDELLRRADAALYAAKEDGRNRVKAGFYPLRTSTEEDKTPAPSAA